MFELVLKISCFGNYSIVTDSPLIFSGSNGRLNAVFGKQLLVLDMRLAFSSTARESTLLI